MDTVRLQATWQHLVRDRLRSNGHAALNYVELAHELTALSSVGVGVVKVAGACVVEFTTGALVHTGVVEEILNGCAIGSAACFALGKTALNEGYT